MFWGGFFLGAGRRVILKTVFRLLIVYLGFCLALRSIGVLGEMGYLDRRYRRVSSVRYGKMGVEKKW